MQKLETEEVLGYQITSGTVSDCITTIIDWIHNADSLKTFVCANPHSLYEASKDDDFRQALLGSDLITPDGSGIILASKILGGGIGDRVTGSDVFWGLTDSLNKETGIKYYFLGSTEETLEKIRKKMATEYPNIGIVGTYSPPFKAEFDDEDNQAMLDAINSTKPDVLWVGMTAPKQEKWINKNKDKLDVKFVGAVGAVFDFFVGNVKRSHPVFLKMGLEWLPRLIQEPRRLWRRNFVSSPMFLFKVFQQKLKSN
jgi:N-acetylglucosaminyldiphosphoundecaprenol N-acetyl-beta-D-mannosaminyltransferase